MIAGRKSARRTGSEDPAITDNIFIHRNSTPFIYPGQPEFTTKPLQDRKNGFVDYQ